MKSNWFLISVACAGLFGACATTIPKELAGARDAYQRASTGPAAKVAPAELHVAHESLVRAERSFRENPDSYETRDFAYVAQRKSELAEAAASIAVEQKSQDRAKDDFVAAQGSIVTKTKEELGQTKSALAASRRSGAMTAGQLSDEQAARGRADERAADAIDGQVAAEQRATEARAAQMAAEKRATDAQIALARLGAVKQETRGIILTLSGSLLFASNQAVLLPAARTRLDQVAEVLLTNPERNLSIEGHTDSQGKDDHNLDLSQRRADAVRNYLVERKYSASRIQANGRGEGQPVADNASAEGRANNRRVEIIIEREAHTSNP